MESLVGVLLGGGILTFIQFLISRHDAKTEKKEAKSDAVTKQHTEIMERFDLVDQKIDALNDKIDEREAVLARTHILRFADELYNFKDVKHTKEYFDQILEDSATYDKFCKDHPDFRNGRTTHAIKYINEIYDKLFREQKFL